MARHDPFLFFFAALGEFVALLGRRSSVGGLVADEALDGFEFFARFRPFAFGDELLVAV